MTGRQKIEVALCPAGTPAMPAVICYEGIFIRDHWRDLTACPWWYAHSPEVEHQLAWLRDVIRAIGQDWFILPLGHSAQERQDLIISVEDVGVFRVNRATGMREPLAPPRVSGLDHNTRSVRPENPPLSAAQVDAAIPIPSDPGPNAVLADGRADLPRHMLQEFGRDLWPFCHVISPLWGCYRLWGFEGMMTLIADDPHLVMHACRRFLELTERRIREAAAIGSAGVWIEECFTDMISPRIFERINLPLVQRMVHVIRQAGMKSIYYYCGNPADRWDLLLAAGADALSLEESKKTFTIDIEDIVAHAQGRCAILGNLDAVGVLQDGSEDDLRREIARQIAAGRRNANRFIMSLGSPVTPATPVERVRRYCDAVHAL